MSGIIAVAESVIGLGIICVLGIWAWWSMYHKKDIEDNK